MRVQAQAGIGELRHVGAADQDEAGRAQPPDRDGVLGRRRAAVQQLRTGPGHLPLDVEQIFDGDGNAAERGRRLAAAAQPVRLLGGPPRSLAIDENEGPLAFATGLVDGGQGGLHKGDAARLAGRQLLGKPQQAAHGLPKPSTRIPRPLSFDIPS